MTTAIAEKTKDTAPPEDANSRSILLAEIIPSKTNPGRSFDPARDTDTMESIKVHGVTQPILIRPLKNLPGGKKYEIVAGERRYSCSIVAGRKTIPAVVRELTDVEALELQTIENDQREDLDPMAKAAAFRRLWDAYEKSGDGKAEQRMERMVERLGRKPRTVWNLLSLSNLSAQGQKLLAEGTITQSHAYEIARRPSGEQKKIVQWLTQQISYGYTVTVRALKQYISNSCDHFLDAAPFPKDDATLFPAAGPCTTCPKNSAVNPNLVDPEDMKGKNGGKRAICTDGECYKVKVANNLVRIEEAAKKEGEIVRVSTLYTAPKGAKSCNDWKQVKAKSCKYAVTGVVVDGDAPGELIQICFATNLCKEHWAHGGGRSQARGVPRSDAEKKAMLQKARNKQLDVAYRVAATAALRKQITALKLPDLQEIAVVLFDRMDRRLQNPVMAAMGWKTTESMYGVKTPTAQIAALKPADLSAFIALVSVADKVLPLPDYYGHPSPLKLEDVAKRHKINLKKIHQQAAAPLQAKWKVIDAKKKAKAKPAQTSAAKKKKAA